MAFGDELLKIAETNPDFVVCNADTKTCGLEKFGKRFPEREFSFGIAEQDLVGGAAGLAACGNKVFLATFATFASMRACEQVRTFVCYPKLNVSIIGTHTGLQVGGDGATHAAIDAAAILREKGIGARVLDMATIKPLDREAVLTAAQETGAILTVEDHTVLGGLGSAVAEVVVQEHPVPMALVGIQNRFGESGDPELIYRDHGMDVDSIVAKAVALVARK